MAAKNTSIAAMNQSIITKLKEVPEVGYHVDDLAKALNFSTKKEVQARLYDLQNKGEVQRLPGNKWRMTPTAAVVPTTTPQQPAATQQKVIPHNTHPSIKLPGLTGFASYKNSLQEYCQKLKYAVPQYKSEKTPGGHFCTVTFGTNVVKGSQARGNPKDSEQQAAFESLIALEYLPREAVFQEISKIAVPGTGQKRKAGDDVPMGEGATPAKQVADGAHVYKSRLNELSQKNKLPAPEYDTVSTPNGFFTTCTFNGKVFKSAVCSKKKKDSEQNAAHMAMYLLNQVTSPPEGYNPAMGEGPNNTAIDNMIAEARAAGTTVSNSAPATKDSAKNRLQEYCQRMKLAELPKYSTDVRADKSVISTVAVAMSSYTGDVCTTKKLAEQSAAFKALMDLGLAAPKADGQTNGQAMQVEA